MESLGFYRFAGAFRFLGSASAGRSYLVLDYEPDTLGGDIIMARTIGRGNDRFR
jgi:hypothetical protein